MEKVKTYVYNSIEELKQVIAEIKSGKDEYYLIKDSAGVSLDYDFSTNTGRRVRNAIVAPRKNPFYVAYETPNESEELLESDQDLLELNENDNAEETSVSTESGVTKDSVPTEEVSTSAIDTKESVNEVSSIKSDEDYHKLTNLVEDYSKELDDKLSKIKDLESLNGDLIDKLNNVNNQYNELKNSYEELNTKYNDCLTKLKELPPIEIQTVHTEYTTDELIEELNKKGYEVIIKK